MALFYQHNINEKTKIGVWHIEETESFFLSAVSLQREIMHPHKRLQHLAGRFLLPFLFPGFPNELIAIADTRKPFLQNEAYHFSISHCGDFAAVMVSKTQRVGIDIEMVTPKVEKIKHKFLNTEELLLLNRQEAIGNEQLAIGKSELTDNQINKLTLLWSCKEAIFKWDGAGGIDFKKDIHLKSIDPEKQLIDCDFTKHKKVALQVHYLYFEKMCMAWTY
ncbi:MAG: 4'-phosphopantetheinyl transferase superfamily protein [Chitinophagaceae bacterium]|nr:4'-phosphopantetheinyl transferase superfamily protein [Chitinophagaceae bacterium]